MDADLFYRDILEISIKYINILIAQVFWRMIKNIITQRLFDRYFQQ